MPSLNDLAKVKLYVGALVMGLSATLFYLGKGDAAQTFAVIGSALLVGLGLNGAGHGIGQAIAMLNPPDDGEKK